MHWAVLSDNNSTICLILNTQRFLLDTPGAHVYRPIHLAANYGRRKAVRALLAQGVDMKSLTIRHTHTTPLHEAARGGDGNAVEQILSTSEGKSTIFSRAFDGRTPLHTAANFGSAEVIKPLLEAIEVIYLSAEDIIKKHLINDSFLTPLHVAAMRGLVSVVRLMMQSRIGPVLMSTACDSGKVPLHMAVLHGNVQVTRQLLEWKSQDSAGTDEVYEQLVADCLFIAARRPQKAVAEMLIEEHLPRMRLIDSETGETVVNAAVFGGFADLLNLIIERVPSGLSFLHTTDQNGETALIQTVSRSAIDLGSSLIEKGADVNAKDKAGNTPLHHAASLRFPKLLKCLIEAGADVEARNTHGESVLLVASRTGVPEIMKMLIESGASADNELLHHRSALSSSSQVTTTFPKSSQDQFAAAFYIRQAFQKALTGNIDIDDSVLNAISPVVSRIVDWAEYWVPSETQRTQSISVTESDGQSVTYLRSMPVEGHATNPVRKITMSITSRQDHGSYRNSWTWFLARREPNQAHAQNTKAQETAPNIQIDGNAQNENCRGPQILRNLHASKTSICHRVCW